MDTDTITIVLKCPPGGSRRRRLWDLPPSAHCPVVGVCLPVALLRRLAQGIVPAIDTLSDYALHAHVVNACRQRSEITNRLQRDLEARCALAIQQSAQCKDTASLAAWWEARRSTPEVAGALWSALTHARCDPSLETAILNDVHMLQHQLGSQQRADLQQLRETEARATAAERSVRELQARLAVLTIDGSRQRERDASELMRLRGLVLARDTALATLRTDQAREKGSREDLRLAQAARRIASLQQRVRRLIALARETQSRRALEERACPAGDDASDAVSRSAPQEAPGGSHLRDKAVLCVGGRARNVPQYRQLVERVGAHFLHHDGGEEQTVAQLDANLTAADIVICQAACVSHAAYWRVKDHCKRFGKSCVFLDNPSRATLARELESIRWHLPATEAGNFENGKSAS